MLVLDSGGVTRLARRRQDSAALIAAFKQDGLWPPMVPTVVLTESITGRQRSDANTNRFLKTCDIIDDLAEPGGAVLTSDLKNLRALATHADGVKVYRA